MLTRLLLALLGPFLILACSMPSAPEKPEYFLNADNKTASSTTAGNLMATAIKDVYELDIVFYPVDLLDETKSALLKADLGPQEIEEVIDLYPSGSNDVFLLGSMEGKDIKKFILKRSQYRYQKDLDVAGIKYDIGFFGGFPTRQAFTNSGGGELEDDKAYRVAVSDVFFFSGMAFPGYKYGDAMNFSLSQEDRKISARETLRTFLTNDKYPWPYLTERRASVSKGQVLNHKVLKTYEIQGAQHVSPYLRHKVTTTGVVTAFGVMDWYPGGVDVYIQDPKGDGRDDTSDGLHVYLTNEEVDLKLGDTITVTGTVYEQVSNNGLGRTSLRDVTAFHLDQRGGSEALPKPVVLGSSGRKIPDKRISTYVGNLNQKPWLNLEDGIDFWESLEGMRVEVKDLRVVGFRGGNEDHESHVGRVKGYLNIYFVTEALDSFDKESFGGGIYADHDMDDYNPEIMQIATNHLSRGFDTTWILNVGEKIPGTVKGVLGYERNIFGDGEYSLVVPDAASEKAFESFKGVGRVTGIENRNNRGEKGEVPTPLESSPEHFTVATFNLENLAGFEDERIKVFANSIGNNLRCPDIVNLVEIQDANGSDFDGSADGTVTLKKMIAGIPEVKNSPCTSVDYGFANIDPILHGEGGKPGGNIRIAILYNKNKVSFISNPPLNSRTEASINHLGSINYNPARVYPNDPVFKGSRKSIVVEFEVAGKKLFVIGNHFNSKLGDGNHWSAIQPPYFRSEIRRTRMADRINDFVQRIEQGSPGAMILVVGDFNAFPEEGSMKTLKGKELWNLTQEFLPKNDRYTTNHNGNSQSLDYIMVNRKLLDRYDGVEVIHLNSDFMGRLSDHDPVLSRFRLSE